MLRAMSTKSTRKPAPTEMVNLTLRVPQALLADFQQLAHLDYDTAPNVLRSLLREYVRENRGRLNGERAA